MSRILVLGAGFVAGPLVQYLLQRKHQLTVASQFLDEAQSIANIYPEISIDEVDVTDEQSLGSLVSKHDVTISFVPFQFHSKVAKQCIKYAKHMITASYESPEMKAFHQQAMDKNITILNEIGLDPGIDHLSAMQVIDSIHQEGGKLVSFVSWCGGLPSPDSNNNPLGYKFAWAPKSVLMALLNEATYLKGGEVITIPAEELLENVHQVDISEKLLLEGYANRDSVSYRHVYGLDEAQIVLRGTLRYRGFSEILQCCKELGLLNVEVNTDFVKAENWRQLLQQNIGDLDSYLEQQSEEAVNGLKWLGLLQKQHLIPQANTVIDAFCQLLIEKLSYTEDEKDMVVLQHKFGSINARGEAEIRHSTLIQEGEVGGFSAMANTVGTPAAIAADLILSGQIDEKGVILPMGQSIYQPILEALAEQGIEMTESMEVVNNIDLLVKI